MPDDERERGVVAALRPRVPVEPELLSPPSGASLFLVRVLPDDERDAALRAGLPSPLAPRLEPVLRDEAPLFFAPLLRLDALPDAPLLDRDRGFPLSLFCPAPVKMSPDNTRCAASATASAINDPSRATELPALLAVSAASEPASRIFLRTLGLALIAAAAAAKPAASISLLIAALASLSIASPVSMPAKLSLLEGCGCSE